MADMTCRQEVSKELDKLTYDEKQNGCHFTDGIFKYIFFNEKVWILIKISLKLVPMGSINDEPSLVHIMACRPSGDKPLSEPMMAWYIDAYKSHTASMN